MTAPSAMKNSAQIQDMSLARTLMITVIGLAPVLIQWFLKEFVYARPFWAYWDHWEANFFFLSRELLEGVPLHNVDHPGFPIIWSGVPLLLTIGSDPQFYEAFLRVSHALTICLYVVGTYFFARTASLRGHVLLPIAAIWLFFAFSPALSYIQVWAPEAFYYPLGLMFLAALVWTIDKPSTDHELTRLALLCGLLAMLISLKFIFVVWAPLLIMSVYFSAPNGVSFTRRFKALVKPLLLALLFSVTSIFVFTYPMVERYGDVVSFLGGMLLNEGEYGRGVRSGLTVELVLRNWGSLWNGNRLFFIVLGFFMLALSSDAYLSRGSGSPVVSRNTGRMLAIAAVGALGFLMLFHRHYADRYAIPIALCGALALVAFTRNGPPRRSFFPGWTTVVVSGALLAHSATVDLEHHRAMIESSRQSFHSLQNAITHAINDHDVVSNPVVVYGWPLVHPSLALRHQAVYSHFQAELDRIYPFSGHVVPWRETARLPNDRTSWDLAVFRRDYIDAYGESAIPVISGSGNRIVTTIDIRNVIFEMDDFVVVAPSQQKMDHLDVDFTEN